MKSLLTYQCTLNIHQITEQRKFLKNAERIFSSVFFFLLVGWLVVFGIRMSYSQNKQIISFNTIKKVVAISALVSSLVASTGPGICLVYVKVNFQAMPRNYLGN